MKILLLDEEEEAKARWRERIERINDQIDVKTAKSPDDICSKFRGEQLNGLVCDIKKNDIDESKLDEKLKETGSEIRFLILIDASDCKIKVAHDLHNEMIVKRQKEFDQVYRIINAFLYEYSYDENRELSRSNQVLRNKEIIDLIFDRYIQAIMARTNNERKLEDEIVKDDMPKAVSHRRIENMVQLGLIETEIEDKDSVDDFVKSYRLDLEGTRISCNDGVISARFGFDDDSSMMYNGKNTNRKRKT